MSHEADQMKTCLQEASKGRHDTIMLDSSSSLRPQFVDLVIPNQYYTGLWNESVGTALGGGYSHIFFIASDVVVDNYEILSELFYEASNNPQIGVYCPSLGAGSRHSFNDCSNKGTNKIRECGLIEGFCFLAKTNILAEIHPVTNNKYGYCIDRVTCDIARRMGYITVVDDRTKIFHPASKSSIDKREATKVGMAFYWTKINDFDKKLKSSLDPVDRNYI
jgi:GT2 family glycosyltransferase